ncbi:MAG: hypothetical protein MR503_02245 [Oscillospiraceae bacterium]|nr:hypothetical protein [Oscillospiraceae bacterium]
MQTTTETELSETGSIENDLSIEGSCSLGNLIAEELNGEYSEQLEANSSGVYSIEVTGTNAAVTFETDRDCTCCSSLRLKWRAEACIYWRNRGENQFGFI